MTQVVERLRARFGLHAENHADEEGGKGLHAPAGFSFLALTGAAAMILLAMTFAAVVATTSRATARDLDRLRGELSRLKTQHRHLVVEQALLRDPLRLRSLAAQQALVAPERVVHIHTGVVETGTPSVSPDPSPKEAQ